jgi:hypothetical protein
MGVTVYSTSQPTQYKVQATLDFGHGPVLPGEGDYAEVFVSAPWVTGLTQLTPSYSSAASTDHDGDDWWVENLQLYCINIQAGSGFTVIGFAPQNTWGKYLINIVGE